MFRAFLATFILAFFFGVGGLMTAEAKNCAGSKSACEAARIAASQGPYNGPKAPTDEPMVCLYALAYGPTELVLADGPSPTGLAIFRWRPSAVTWRPWRRDMSLVVGEICIPARLLHGRSAVTLCNGTASGAHSTWGAHDIGHLLSVHRVTASDPACLLGKGPCGEYGL